MTGNIPDTVVILRDQAEEFPPCQQLYSCQTGSESQVHETKVRDGGLGFTTGIPRVQISNTVPLPVNTVTVAGEGMTPYMFGYSIISKKN